MLHIRKMPKQRNQKFIKTIVCMAFALALITVSPLSAFASGWLYKPENESSDIKEDRWGIYKNGLDSVGSTLGSEGGKKCTCTSKCKLKHGYNGVNLEYDIALTVEGTTYLYKDEIQKVEMTCPVCAKYLNDAVDRFDKGEDLVTIANDLESSFATRCLADFNDESDVSSVERKFSGIIFNLGYWLNSILTTDDINMTIDGIVLGKMATTASGSGVSVCYAQFDLSKGNPYGIIGAWIYVYARMFMYSFFLIYFVFMLYPYLLKGGSGRSGKQEAEFKEFLSNIFLFFGAMMVMPYLVNVILFFRDMFIYYFMHNLNLHLSGTSVASGIVDAWQLMYLEKKTVLYAILYDGAVGAGLFFFGNYVGTALIQVILFGLSPFMCLSGVKNRKNFSTCASSFLFNLITPLIDALLLLVPMYFNQIYAANVANFEVTSWTSNLVIVMIMFIAIWSVIPTRTLILRYIGANIGVGAPKNGISGLVGLGMLGMRAFRGGFGRSGNHYSGGDSPSISDDLKTAKAADEEASILKQSRKRTASGQATDIDDVLNGNKQEDAFDSDLAGLKDKSTEAEDATDAITEGFDPDEGDSMEKQLGIGADSGDEDADMDALEGDTDSAEVEGIDGIDAAEGVDTMDDDIDSASVEHIGSGVEDIDAISDGEDVESMPSDEELVHSNDLDSPDAIPDETEPNITSNLKDVGDINTVDEFTEDSLNTPAMNNPDGVGNVPDEMGGEQGADIRNRMRADGDTDSVADADLTDNSSDTDRLAAVRAGSAMEDSRGVSDGIATETKAAAGTGAGDLSGRTLQEDSRRSTTFEKLDHLGPNGADSAIDPEIRSKVGQYSKAIPNFDSEFASKLTAPEDVDRYANLAARDAMNAQIMDNHKALGNIDGAIGNNNKHISSLNQGIASERASISAIDLKMSENDAKMMDLETSMGSSKNGYDTARSQVQTLTARNAAIDKEISGIYGNDANRAMIEGRAVNPLTPMAAQKIERLQNERSANLASISSYNKQIKSYDGLAAQKSALVAENRSLENSKALHNSNIADYQNQISYYNNDTAAKQQKRVDITNRNQQLSSGIERATARENNYAADSASIGMSGQSFKSANAYQTQMQINASRMNQISYRNFDSEKYNDLVSPEKRAEFARQRALRTGVESGIHVASTVAGVGVGAGVAAAASYGGPRAMVTGGFVSGVAAGNATEATLNAGFNAGATIKSAVANREKNADTTGRTVTRKPAQKPTQRATARTQNNSTTRAKNTARVTPANRGAQTQKSRSSAGNTRQTLDNGQDMLRRQRDDARMAEMERKRK